MKFRQVIYHILSDLFRCEARITKDNAIVVGIPGREITYNGSEGYVSRTDYDPQLAKRLRITAN